MTDENLKITDKRMFTPEGDLREEYRHLEDARPGEEVSGQEPATTDGGGTPTSQGTAPETPSAPGSGPETVEEPAAATDPEPPATAEESSEPARESTGRTPEATFMDLVGLLAQHASIYLQNVGKGGDESRQNLELAQAHIDLLDVLRAKTSGNLTGDESAMLGDVLYQLRLAYVQMKRETG